VKDPGEVKVMYLGYYVPWSVRGNEFLAQTLGFTPAPERTSGTYTAGSSIDDGIDRAHYWVAANKASAARPHSMPARTYARASSPASSPSSSCGRSTSSTRATSTRSATTSA